MPATAAAGRAGIAPLVERMAAMLNTHPVRTWGPHTQKLLRGQLEAVEFEQVLLGLPALQGDPALAKLLAVQEAVRIVQESGMVATQRFCDEVLAPVRRR